VASAFFKLLKLLPPLVLQLTNKANKVSSARDCRAWPRKHQRRCSLAKGHTVKVSSAFSLVEWNRSQQAIEVARLASQLRDCSSNRSSCSSRFSLALMIVCATWFLWRSSPAGDMERSFAMFRNGSPVTRALSIASLSGLEQAKHDLGIRSESKRHAGRPHASR